MNKATRLALVFCGLICVFALVNLSLVLFHWPMSPNSIQLASSVAWSAFPIVFAVVSGLIIARQPFNRIGWLLMVPAIFFVAIHPVDRYLGSFASAPDASAPILLMIWFQNWSWLLLIIPLLLILLLFPTGNPPSQRWRWVLWYALVVFLVMPILSALIQKLTPSNNTWTLQNPIGVIAEDSAVTGYFVTPWIISLGLLVLICTASLFARYRSAPQHERQQIKWLLFAGSIFVVFYVPLLGWQGNTQGWAADLADLLLAVTPTLFPIAIAIAILRYRLWDIDVIIRRTLQYSLVTGLLAMVYFGSVLVGQRIAGALTGEQNSPLVVVISTLLVAALFGRLRARVQDFIDRRFFRQKYDAIQTLAAFTEVARDETRLEALTPALLEAVQDSMQPELAWLWLKETGRSSSVDGSKPMQAR